MSSLRGTVGNSNLVSLGDLAGGIVESQAISIAGNGSTVVGWGTIAGDVHAAFLWDPILTNGNMISLRDYLVNNQGLGAALTGWTLNEALAISDDGSVIVGTGTNPQGRPEAFRVSIAGGSTVDPDFNNDGLVNCGDVNSLVQNIAGATNNAAYDLNGDGSVNILDLNRWRADAGAINLGAGRVYLVGDANLDSVVDGSDFGIWNSHKFTSLPAWCSGDFNADGVIDGSDFGLWNSNKFTSADSASSLVPEPSFGVAGLVGLFSILGIRRHVRR